MIRFEANYVNENRKGNKANDQEWAIISRWLTTGNLSGQKDLQICYNNMKKNKKWYYDMNYNKPMHFSKVLSEIVIATLACAPIVYMMLQKVFGIYGPMSSSFYNTAWIFLNTVISNATLNIFSYVIRKKQINDLEKSLKHNLRVENKKRIKGLDLFHQSKNYTQQNSVALKEEVNRTYQTNNSSFNSQEKGDKFDFIEEIHKEINFIKTTMYPGCKTDLTSLHDLAIEYIENIMKQETDQKSRVESLYRQKLYCLRQRIISNMKSNNIAKSERDFINKNQRKQYDYFENMGGVVKDFLTDEEATSIKMSNTHFEDKGISRNLKHEK